jgi:hypothetical protein
LRGDDSIGIRRKSSFALQIFLQQQRLLQTKGAYDGR